MQHSPPFLPLNRTYPFDFRDKSYFSIFKMDSVKEFGHRKIFLKSFMKKWET